jgi:hypothetical protein
VHILDMKLSNAMIDKPSTHPSVKAASQLLDAASRRFNSGLKTLATIQKLLRPGRSTFDLLTRPGMEKVPSATGAKRDVIPLSEGAPVVN